MNEMNLTSFNKMSESRQKEIASMGGKASAKARRERRTLKETLEDVLSMSLKSGEYVDIEEIQSISDVKGQNITVQDAIVISIVQKAMRGNVSCAEWVRDTSGQKQTEKVSVNGSVNNPFSNLTTEELRRLLDDE